MAKKYGLQAYTVQESNNLQLGQNGFDVFYNGAEPDNTEGNWVALLGISTSSGGSVGVCAETVIGDNLSDNGSTGEVQLVNNVIVYGTFNKIVSANISAGEVLIAYRG
tara:strand:+ start:2964 stop:3287 length:324 start_codon:yes stop_codon:yes gene_type:complete